jgi:hypothetical protein
MTKAILKLMLEECMRLNRAANNNPGVFLQRIGYAQLPVLTFKEIAVRDAEMKVKAHLKNQSEEVIEEFWACVKALTAVIREAVEAKPTLARYMDDLVISHPSP